MGSKGAADETLNCEGLRGDSAVAPDASGDQSKTTPVQMKPVSGRNDLSAKSEESLDLRAAQFRAGQSHKRNH